MATRAVSLEDEVGRSFEEEWPELTRRLERFLAAKGVETWLRGDVVQETATRVYRKWSRLDHSRPLWNLVVTIALGILVDERRRTSRVELVSDVRQPDLDDVEARALHRVHLVDTRAALEQLGADQRRVLLAEIGEATALEGPRSRINVLRLRARLALRGELGPLAPAGVALRVRSLKAAADRRFAEWGRDAHAVTSSIASIAVAGALFVGGAGLGVPNPGRPGSLPPIPQVLSLDEIRNASHFRAAEDISRPGTRKLGWRAKDRAEGDVEGQSVLLQDPEGFVENKREWAESRGQYAEAKNKSYVEDKKKWAEGRKDYAEDKNKAYLEDKKEWAEDRLP
jgi:DNA-directed RNA polymerase specialized sigma24 family protein